MRLKRVRIFGFKTFADRTEVSLEGGVIAVVGPNGCGKSNLVDAILWGLGEGNARQLRAQTGQDVIFNGSARRKGVGFAEVTLLFDNEDGSLPIDTPEVAITRRLTRSGDSEYSINRRSCRQRDVFELLADSGLGRAGYAIVGQKEIDAALNASVEDRRGWIDEAAGVQRYRQRKSESLRRLAAAHEHLQRVSDILTELDSQREPLRLEAEQAARYRSIQSTLQDVEIGYLIKEVAEAETDLVQLEERIASSLRLSREETARADGLDEAVAKHGANISQIEIHADDARIVLQDQLTAAERAEADIRLKQQRLEALDEQERTLALDGVEIESRLKEAELEASRTAEEESVERTTLDELRSGMEGVGEESQQLSRGLKEVEHELAKARESEARRLKVDADRAHRLERLKLAKRELTGAKEALPDLEAGLVEAEASIGHKSGALAEAEAAIQAVSSNIEEVRSLEEAEAREVRGALAEKASLEGRKRGIEATIEAHEGLAQGPRAVLEASERGTLKGHYIPVGQAIDVKREHAVAIETALGASANDLIVEHESEAKEAIGWLKENRAGRATFQPIPLMRPFHQSPELRQLLVRPGVIGSASELVTCEPIHQPVIDSLLGRVLVVKDLDFAFALAKTSGWTHLVTLAGEIVHSSGAVTGGHQTKQGYGLVQRKADLADIERELGRLSKAVSSFEKSSESRSKQIEELESQLPSLRAARAEADSELGDTRSFQRTVQDEMKSAQKEIERLEREIAQPLPEFTDEKVDLEEIETRRDLALRALASKSADVEQAENRLREAKERLTQAQGRSEAAAKRLEAALHAEQSRERRAENIEPEREKARKEIALAESTLALAKRKRQEAEELLEKLQREKRSLLEESLRLAEEAKHIRDNVGAIGAAVHQAELSRTRADGRRTSALVRLAEDYGLAPDEVAEQKDKYDPPADAPSIVQRLRRELRAMGDVNLGAIEAFDRLSTRFVELEAQKEDVEGGIAEVEASIRELDKLTKDKFADTFEKVQIAFAEMFTKLFGGGEGQIALTDPMDILNSGIEIEVTLPGKKRQALNLLSGGERALCTAAFLFALLRVKPSPLVVLDEVDAPLDGRNVERFAATLQEFSKESQFIVITHNENTIASAPIWLGVTMQEPGVSTLLPARVPEAKQEMAKEIPIPVWSVADA